MRPQEVHAAWRQDVVVSALLAREQAAQTCERAKEVLRRSEEQKLERLVWLAEHKL